ncbi:hypothetical protein COM83_25100 [Bacillus cereus]|nr:hypothetical protein COM83_25100 [Bacillus cereus]
MKSGSKDLELKEFTKGTGKGSAGVSEVKTLVDKEKHLESYFLLLRVKLRGKRKMRTGYLGRNSIILLLI